MYIHIYYNNCSNVEQALFKSDFNFTDLFIFRKFRIGCPVIKKYLTCPPPQGSNNISVKLTDAVKKISGIVGSIGMISEVSTRYGLSYFFVR